jgi:hypothetical protein
MHKAHVKQDEHKKLKEEVEQARIALEKKLDAAQVGARVLLTSAVFSARYD